MKKKIETLYSLLYNEKSKASMYIALCATVFVYGFMYRIIDLRSIFWCALPFCLYYIFDYNSRNSFDLNFLLIYSATLIVAVISIIRDPMLNTYWSDSKLAWILPTVYILGKACVGNDDSYLSRRVFGAITSLSFGMFLQAVLDHTRKSATQFDGGAAWFSFWKDDYEVRTVFDFGLLLMISSFYYAFKIRKDMVKSLTIGACAIIGLVLNLNGGGRTGLLVFIINLAICFCIDCIKRRKELSKIIINRNYLKTIGIILTIIGLLVVVLFCGWNKISNVYNMSFWSRDGGIFRNIRVMITVDGIKKAIAIPQGGWEGLYYGRTHDTWLEFARTYNSFVYVFLLMTIIHVFLQLVNIAFVKKWYEAELYYLVSSLITMFAYMTLEPVGAKPMYFYVIFYIYICGIVAGVSDNM